MPPTYDDMITWIALNDKGASGTYRMPHEYNTLETVKMVAHLYNRPVKQVAMDVLTLQKTVLQAIDEG